MAYKNPPTPKPQDPVFIDKAITEIQTSLEALPWLERSWGRSYIKVENRGGSDMRRTPMVYKGEADYLPVEFNDNLTAQSFWEVGDQRPYDNGQYDVRAFNCWSVDVACIFWCDLKAINEPLGDDYYFAEVLKAEVRDIFRKGNYRFSEMKVNRIIEDVDEIFTNYTFTQERKQYFSYPYVGFKFFIELIVEEECTN